jgi:hypothetical protein
MCIKIRAKNLLIYASLIFFTQKCILVENNICDIMQKMSDFKTSGFKTSVFKTSETSGLQNVRFTKRQVFKTSGCKKTSIYILYLWLVEIRRFCCSHVNRQSDGCVLLSILEGFLPYITKCKNDTLFTLNSNANLAIPILHD